MSERDDKRRGGDEIDPGAPDFASPTAEESLAAERLRDALESPSRASTAADELDLVEALRAAWSPEALEEGVHAEMLDDLPMSAEETLLAAELRDALDGTKEPEVVVALRAAWTPSALDDREHRALVDAAVGRRGEVVELKRRARSSPVLVLTTTALALAASVLVWITTGAPRPEAALAKSRSTQPLFDEPFRAGDASARIDRIAVARASDYRDNRFAKWGVR